MSGSPPTTTINPAPILRPADYRFASSFWNNVMPNLVGQPLPQFPGQIDPGMSPTTQIAQRMAQGYGLSQAPFSWGQAQGLLGGLMGGGGNNWQYQPFPQQQNTLSSFMNPQMPNFAGGAPSFFGPGANSWSWPNPAGGGGFTTPWTGMEYSGGGGTSQMTMPGSGPSVQPQTTFTPEIYGNPTILGGGPSVQPASGPGAPTQTLNFGTPAPNQPSFDITSGGGTTTTTTPTSRAGAPSYADWQRRMAGTGYVQRHGTGQGAYDEWLRRYNTNTWGGGVNPNRVPRSQRPGGGTTPGGTPGGTTGTGLTTTPPATTPDKGGSSTVDLLSAMNKLKRPPRRGRPGAQG